MNTELENKPLGSTMPFARTPERWLLVGPDEAWCERTREALAAAARELDAEDADGPSFLAWRLMHGLLRVLPPAELDAALTQALTAPTADGVQRNATRLWAAMSETEWFSHSDRCAALRLPSARGLNVSLMKAESSGAAAPDDAADLSGFLQAADQPDALSRLTWLMSGRLMPVPRSWLALGPLPERSAEQNAAMAKAGYRCYAAWAQAVLDGSDADELQALWGPFPDDDADDETEGANETGADNSAIPSNVARLDDFRLPKPVRPQAWDRYDDEGYGSGRLAASSALSGSGADGDLLDPTDPLHTWSFDQPATARGASQLQAFALPAKAPGGLPRIEWVARWTSSKHLPDHPEDICLVVTLPKRKPVLLKGRPEREGGTHSLRFAWPSDRLPSDAPTSPVRLVGWLSELLPLARVSLQ